MPNKVKKQCPLCRGTKKYIYTDKFGDDRKLNCHHCKKKGYVIRWGWLSRAKCSELYNRNFDKIMEHLGTDKQKHYTTRERRLEKICVNIQKDLHIYITNPCPLIYKVDCAECSGYYDTKKTYTPSKRLPQTRSFMITEIEGIEKGKELCILKKPI